MDTWGCCGWMLSGHQGGCTGGPCTHAHTLILEGQEQGVSSMGEVNENKLKCSAIILYGLPRGGTMHIVDMIVTTPITRVPKLFISHLYTRRFYSVYFCITPLFTRPHFSYFSYFTPLPSINLPTIFFIFIVASPPHNTN